MVAIDETFVILSDGKVCEHDGLLFDTFKAQKAYGTYGAFSWGRAT